MQRGKFVSRVSRFGSTKATIVLLLSLVAVVAVASPLIGAPNDGVTKLEEYTNETYFLEAPSVRMDSRDIRLVGGDRVEALLPGAARIWRSSGESMVPTVGDGHIQVTVEVDVAKIEVGDYLVYKHPATGDVVGHRVVATGYDHAGWYAHTQGDRNFEKDLFTVREDDVIGVVAAIFY